MMTIKKKINENKNAIIRVSQSCKKKIDELQKLIERNTGYFVHYTEIIEKSVDLLLKQELQKT